MAGQNGASQLFTPGQKQKRTRRSIITLIVCLVVWAVMFPTVFLVGELLKDDGPTRIDDALAGATAFVLLPMALIMVIVHSLFPRHASLQGQRLAQILNAAASGLTLLLPLFGGRFIDPTLAFAIGLILTVVVVFTGWLIWRAADELMRDLMKDTWLAGFFVSFAVLSVYAIGERLGLLSGVTAWGALAFVHLLNIVCSVWVVYRRGLSHPPLDD